MASKRIRGITIDIDGNVTKLSDSLKSVDTILSKTESNLKDVNRLLKLDPTNTELLSQKQKLLNDAITSTKEKLEIEKDALERVKAANKTGEMTEEQMALEREIASTQIQLRRYEGELDGTAGSMTNLGNQSDDTSDKLDKISDNTRITALGALADGLKNIADKLIQIGKKALDAFHQMDDGLDTIKAKTGATGDTLAGLEGTAKKIFTTSTASMDDVGTAVGEVNTRFGSTGAQLESLSAKFLKFAKLNGEDVNSSIDGVQKSMAAFGISTDKAEAVLDLYNKVGQDTGITMSTLYSDMTSYRSTLKSFGLNAAQSATLLGNLEKSGVDVSQALTGMKKVQTEALKNGTSVQEEFQKAVSNSSDALSIFGAKAGPQLYEAFQSGVLSVSMFTDQTTSLNDSLGSIDETFASTQDGLDELTKAQHAMTEAEAELGASIGETLAPMLQIAAEAVRTLAEFFTSLPEPIRQAIVVVGLIVAALGSLAPVIMAVAMAATALNVGMLPIIGIVALVVAAIAALVAIGVLLAKNWDKIKETAANVWSSVKQTFGDGVQKVKDKVRQLGELPRKALEWGKDFIDGFARGIKEKIGKVVDAVKGVGAKIKRFLHFSRPDEGPLHEYEEWPRDFVEGYAQGIRSNLYRITDASGEMAAAMAYPTGSGAAARSAAESSGIMSAVGQDITRGVAALQGLTVVMDTGQTVGALAPKMTSKVVDNITKDWRWK